MTDAKERGRRGEELTALYLRKNGFIIFERNYHSRYGEIDIIAQKEKLLLFVEVKTRTANALFAPGEAVDFHKQRKIRRTAEDFLSKTHLEYFVRFDVAEVTAYKAEDGNDRYRLNYIKAAFM